MIVKLADGKQIEVLSIFTIGAYPYDYALCIDEEETEDSKPYVLRAIKDEDNNLLLNEIDDATEKEYVNKAITDILDSLENDENDN